MAREAFGMTNVVLTNSSCFFRRFDQWPHIQHRVRYLLTIPVASSGVSIPLYESGLPSASSLQIPVASSGVSMYCTRSDWSEDVPYKFQFLQAFRYDTMLRRLQIQVASSGVSMRGDGPRDWRGTAYKFQLLLLAFRSSGRPSTGCHESPLQIPVASSGVSMYQSSRYRTTLSAYKFQLLLQAFRCGTRRRPEATRPLTNSSCFFRRFDAVAWLRRHGYKTAYKFQLLLQAFRFLLPGSATIEIISLQIPVASSGVSIVYFQESLPFGARERSYERFT